MSRPATHRLLLLRHAKSSWDEPSTPDRDRPLAKRGRHAAQRIGDHLRADRLFPDLVLCSSSRRTRETLERLRIEGAEVSVEDGLYGASDDELLERVRELGEAVGSALLIGHNPGIADLAIALAGPSRSGDATRLREKFPTGALAMFELDGPWSELGGGTVRLASFTVPRDLG